ncbi:MAG TPA: bifunctional YncE family protein/alkaline phosphatase family protein [Ignavibacteriaceae bacterium]|nr:bifunctional YncE family protein/alkaline phosphatase family protein [Ignavibacteriaceae bacterium]
MVKTKLIPILISLLIFSGCNDTAYKRNSGNKISLPGKFDKYVLLPNGWKLTPAGDQIGIGELPLNLIITHDEKYAVTSNSGTKENSISVIDLEKKKEIQRISIDKTWRGLVFNKDDSKLFVSGGNNNAVYIFNFTSARLALTDSIILGKYFPKEEISITGLDYWIKENLLLAVSKMSNTLYVCSIKAKKVLKKVKLGGECYDVKINHSGTYAYISLWSKSSIAEVDLNTFSITNMIEVGNHPTEILITNDDDRLFTADANNNTISAVDLKLKKETEKIISSLHPDAPYGSTPNAVCFNKDETVLIAANADNNYLALFNISKKNNSQSIGFIPVGWYPTSVKMLGSNKIIAANGKGLSSSANPRGPEPTVPDDDVNVEYIGSLFKGSLSIINYPGIKYLSSFSKQVYENTPYTGKKNILTGQKIIPAEFNNEMSRKIKHVFYIIKENRTYDQVYGDIEKGNGDSSICILGKQVTPNQHKLTLEFTLFDNFYCDAEVSADGHNWSMAAYATDYVEKTWPTYYGGRGGNYDFEGSEISAPSSGYIWNQVIKKNLSLRNYGEFVEEVKGSKDIYKSNDGDLERYTCKKYPGFDLEISDLTRYSIWEKEFDEYSKNDSLPVFNLIRLPNDHTMGTTAGKLTPQAYVAQNDYALGLMVEKISKSRFWKESIIFVLEDDAQNGSDHVDAHRSTLLVVSPYIKRNFVDHTMYSTSGVLKTIELILGLKPMTQFDLSANPILNPITDEPNFGTFNSLKPLIDIEARNKSGSYGSKRSSEFNFAKEDDIPDVELNEIIWKSIKGKNSKMPSPVRSAFVNVVVSETGH